MSDEERMSRKRFESWADEISMPELIRDQVLYVIDREFDRGYESRGGLEADLAALREAAQTVVDAAIRSRHEAEAVGDLIDAACALRAVLASADSEEER